MAVPLFVGRGDGGGCDTVGSGGGLLGAMVVGVIQWVVCDTVNSV